MSSSVRLLFTKFCLISFIFNFLKKLLRSSFVYKLELTKGSLNKFDYKISKPNLSSKVFFLYSSIIFFCSPQ